MKIEKVAQRLYGRAQKRNWLVALTQLAILVLVAIALFHSALFSTDRLPAGAYDSDLMLSSWPTGILIQQSIAQGHGLPLWNPFYAGGQPLGADPLAALFYPPTWLIPFLPLREYYLLIIIGHLVFAGVGMLLLARKAFGLPTFAALVAAISYMATPRLLSHLGAGHITIFQVVTWLPWLALTCWLTIQHPRRYGISFALALALTLLAGHPQLAYYGILMVAGMSAWLLLKRWRTEGLKTALLSLAGLATAGVTGALLAAIHLLPLMEFTARSTRQLSVSSKDKYPLSDFIHALLGQQGTVWNSWEVMITPGLVVLVLALLAIAVHWRKVWPLTLGIILIAGLAMGNASSLYRFVSHFLPDFDRFRGLARIWFIGLLGIALLAGSGTKALQAGIQRFSRRGSTLAGIGMVLLVALTLIITDRGYARITSVQPATTPSATALAAAQLAGSGRIYCLQSNITQLNAADLQLRLTNGQDPLLLQSYVAYMQHAGGYTASGYQLHIPPTDSPAIQPDAVLLGLMHTSLVISNRPLSDPHLIQVESVQKNLIYKNTADAGPGYLVQSGPDGNPPSLNQLHRLPATVHLDSQTSDTSLFNFENSSSGYFVIATPTFPGWTAELDGQVVPVQQLGDIFPAIRVQAGHHTLKYSYQPASVHIGALLSGLGLLIVLIWLFTDYCLNRKVHGHKIAEHR